MRNKQQNLGPPPHCSFLQWREEGAGGNLNPCCCSSSCVSFPLYKVSDYWEPLPPPLEVGVKESHMYIGNGI